MGAESFFIHAKAINAQIDTNKFITLLSSNDYIVEHNIRYNVPWYAINGILKLQFSLENASLQGFSLEGCFSWYDESLELIYQIVKLINDKLMPIEIDQPVSMESKKLLDKERFLNTVRGFYEGKYKYFSDLFKGARFKSLPDKDFYNEYKRRKSPLFKILNVFKGK